LLVQDACRIRQKFKDLKGHLLADVETNLLPSTFIECHQAKVLQAKQHVSTQAQQANLEAQRDTNRSKVQDAKARDELLENY